MTEPKFDSDAGAEPVKLAAVRCVSGADVIRTGGFECVFRKDAISGGYKLGVLPLPVLTSF